MHPIILKAFHATLGELATADLVLFFIDASEAGFSLGRKVRSCEVLDEAEVIIRRYFPNEAIVPISVADQRNLTSLLSLVKSRLQSQRLLAKPRKPQARH